MDERKTGSFHRTTRAVQAPIEGGSALSRSQQERARHDLRHAAFAKAGAELYLERVSDEMALIRLNIGHMSFGIGQPRNGTEAASVLRTFREALTDLLAAAVACNEGGK